MASQSLEGSLQAGGKRFAIVRATFNSLVTDRLLAGARKGLERCGVSDADVLVAHVPGAWELPIVAKRLAQAGGYHAVICLGAVVRGDTPHFDYVSAEAARGIADASASTGVPVIFGVLTTNTMEQALDRAGGKAGNKGYDAALSAVEMVTLLAQIPGGR
jgi:6,7-dimethyl-8-ribityllumazine synthase